MAFYLPVDLLTAVGLRLIYPKESKVIMVGFKPLLQVAQRVRKGCFASMKAR